MKKERESRRKTIKGINPQMTQMTQLTRILMLTMTKEDTKENIFVMNG